MRTPGGEVVRGRWGKSAVHGSPSEPLAVDDVAVLRCCTAPGPAGEVAQPELPLFRPDLSPVGVNRASVMRCGRWLLPAGGHCCCCCHRCCQQSDWKSSLDSSELSLQVGRVIKVMQVLPVDPRDTRWEVPHPTYRVSFWQRQQPHNPLSGWAPDEWEIQDADIDEVLTWARGNA